MHIFFFEVNGLSDVGFLLRYAFDKTRMLMTDEKVIHYDDDASDLLLKAKFKRYSKSVIDGKNIFFPFLFLFDM